VRTTIILPGHINTPLFSTAHFPDRWWYRFFLPPLVPVAAVKAIIAALDEQQSREIFMPFYAQFSPYIQLLPSYARDWFQWVRFFLSVSFTGVVVKLIVLMCR
jgi:hypothetical protein